MNAKEIIKRVKQIELKTLRKTDALFLGEYHSSFKGRGMTFSEIRPYQYGDDVRKIDWNKTARFSEPYIKVFEEERELTLMLLVDVTASMDFGTRKQIKRETVAEICATLGFSAIKNNDKVGLILFSDKIEMFLPPKKGRSHVLRIIRELIDFTPQKNKVNLNKTLDFFLKTVKRKAITFIFSDFDTDESIKNLALAAKKHDLTGVRIYDSFESIVPNIGIALVQDIETNTLKWLNTSSKTVRNKYEDYFRRLEINASEKFKKAGAGFINIASNEDYIKALLSYFKTHTR